MRVILILIVILSAELLSLSDNIYPNILIEGKTYNDGRVRNFKFDNSVYSYYVIPNWTGRSEFVYIENTLNPDTQKAVRLNFNFIYDIIKLRDNLLAVAKKNDSLYVFLSDKDLNISKSVFLMLQNDYKSVPVKSTKEKKHIIINNYLYEISSDSGFEMKLVDNAVSDFIYLDSSLVYLTDENGISSLKMLSGNKKNTIDIFDSFEKQKLMAADGKIAILGSNSISGSTAARIIDPEKNNESRNFWIESSIELTASYKNLFAYVKKKDNTYFLEAKDFSGSLVQSRELSGKIYEPLLLQNTDSSLTAIFRNAIINFRNFQVDFKADYPAGEYFNSAIDLKISDNQLILSSESYSQIFEIKKNNLWQLKKYVALFYEYLIPILIVIIIIALLQYYRHQKRYVTEILELPSIGLVLIIDRNGRLNNKNSKAHEILNIPYNIKGKKSFEYFFPNKNYRPFLEMIQRSFKTRLDHYKRINIADNGISKEWYCRTVILKNLTGQFRGLIFTALDITEQLERKRLSNWASLAHDMQTNLSTIRLNAQQILDDNNENKKRKDKIIHQVNVLFNRVRDIVTVGRDSKADKQPVNASEICMSARDEFDEIMFPNIEFSIDLQSFVISCDKNKLIRAIRNSIENGIKAIKNNYGKIEIRCYRDSKFGYFSIKDTGVGMDETVRKKMLNPYFTTGGNTGGSGIGTMIMLHVVELHNGFLEINSKKGEGTEILFKLPLGKSNVQI
jgi:signal transduction histidine kinase